MGYLTDLTDEQWAWIEPIVLCAQQQPNETVEERARRMLGTSRAAKSCLDIIELPRMDNAVFFHNVFDPWLKAMNAELSPKFRESLPQVLAKVYLVTAGDWIRIASLTTDFMPELDAQNRNPRLITEEIANRVFARRMKILGMLGVK